MYIYKFSKPIIIKTRFVFARLTVRFLPGVPGLGDRCRTQSLARVLGMKLCAGEGRITRLVASHRRQVDMGWRSSSPSLMFDEIGLGVCSRLHRRLKRLCEASWEAIRNRLGILM
jgi:hypothetical protein